MFEGHRKRAEKVRGYFSRKGAVALFAILASIALLFSLVMNHQVKETEPQETVQSENVEGWQFYPVDLIVLGAGGGLCVVMILREKRRAKEELN
ncbi:MAG: hypothetical protein VZR73_07715 [Acutalibacteraceae bacterium]|nr:hypothetical protein [Oscillospiraceae bacterium]MBP0989274.1 hypothetical protein [Oscillospiraceae bacterium]MEE3403954.1 hypothetical protein [Acutalibacteraceae bacterium]